MAGSFSNAKNVSGLLAGKISAVASRRGYAAAAAAAAALAGESGRVKTGAPKLMLKRGAEESAEISWVPDPVSGYYRPENQTKELDAAELRAMLLKKELGRN